MDLEDVRVFLHVAKDGSFTKAAKKLALPKSTVSRRVSDLEDALSVRLLHRTTRKLSLTDAGQLLVSRTAHVLDDLENAETALEEMQSEPRGVVRVTIPGDLSGAFAAMVREFTDRYPHVRLVVFATGRRVDLVSEGYDLALRAGTLADSSLMSRKLAATPLALFASPKYLEKAPPLTCPEHLSQHPCLLFGLEGTQSVYRLHGQGRSVDVKVEGPLCSNDMSLLRSAAAAGLGVCLVPLLEAARDLRRGTLVRVLPDYQGDEGGIYAVYPSSRHLPPRVRAFLDFCAEWLGDEHLVCTVAHQD